MPTSAQIRPRPWLARVLQVAALYNLAWGAWQVLAPQSFFSLLGMDPTNYPMIWQGMGMVIGVYGLAYFWASFDYIRHWPIVAVGLLGKVFGPLGFGLNYLQGTAPAGFGYTLLTNDLLWWWPFSLMLWHARQAGFPLR
jgi:small multidrug resistance pump